MKYEKALKLLEKPPFDRQVQRDYYGKIERVKKFLGAIGNPEKLLKVIIVGGTVGKGSACYFLSRLLMNAGYSVGLSVSPHLQSPRERIQVNESLVNKRTFSDMLVKFLPLARSLRMSFPEFMVGLATIHFARMKVDYAVFEVGLGGRYDPVNALEPMVTVITNIGEEHVYKLGKSPLIRLREKYGIVRSGIPLITGVSQPSLKQWLSKRTKLDNVSLHAVNLRDPDFRINNYALAKYIFRKLEYKKATSISLQVPGRFEQLAPNLLIDSAHNRPGLRALQKLIRLSGNRNYILMKAKPGNNPASIKKFVQKVAGALGRGDHVCATGSVFAVGALRDIWWPVD